MAEPVDETDIIEADEPDQPSEWAGRDPAVVQMIQFLRGLRISLEIPQWDIAERAGIKQPQLSMIEKGATVNVSSDVLARIARALGLEMTLIIPADADPDYADFVVELMEKDGKAMPVGIVGVE